MIVTTQSCHTMLLSFPLSLTFIFFVFIVILMLLSLLLFIFFFFNDTATTEIYTLSLHDALPICRYPQVGGSQTRAEEVRRSCRARCEGPGVPAGGACADRRCRRAGEDDRARRSEEHTSELQSHLNLVCRLLLEKKKKEII